MGSELRFAVTFTVFAVSLSMCGSQYISPDPAFVGTGGNVSLTCQHPSRPGGNVRWARGQLGTLTSALDDPRLSIAGSQLIIDQFLGTELAGRYWCIVDPMEEGTAQTLISCPAEVKHARIPAGLLVQPDHTTAYEGTNVILRCSPHPSVPPAVIAWTHNGQTLDAVSSSRLHISLSGNLYILGVVSSDAGTYRCIASNPVTNARRRSDEVVLTVEVATNETVVAPTIAVEPRTAITAMEGSRVVLECAGRGYPQPSESWVISNDRVFHVEVTGELVIDSVTASHAGTYTCKIRDKNHTLVAERHVELTVRVPPRLTATPPPQLLIQQGNTSATISCSANASDTLQLFILHNGTILHTATGQDPVAQATPPSHQIGTSHTFQCIALNAFGCDNIKTTVTFTGDTTPTGATPTSGLPGNDSFTPSAITSFELGSGITPAVPMLDLRATSPLLRAHVGDRHMASCEVTGPTDSELTLTWFQGGSTRDLHSEPVDGIVVQMSVQVGGSLTSTLEFQAVRKAHNGSYTCHGSIKGYNVEMTATVTLIVLEDTPITSMPTADTTDFTSAAESHSSTSTGAQITQASTPAVSHVTTTASTEPTGLDPDMTPPHRPANLQVKLHPLTSDIEVTWNDSEHSILGFKINWDHPNMVKSVARDSLAKDTVAGEYIYTISGDSYRRYNLLTVYVWAYNINGDGPIAEVEISPSGTGTMAPMTTAPPTPPLPAECYTTPLSPTMFRINWPEEFADTSSSLDITLQCTEAQSHRTAILAPPISSTHHVISNALPSCSYFITVHSAGRTAECTVLTDSGQVSIRTNVTRFSNGTVRLTWLIPPEIRDSDLLVVEINLGEGWVQITANHHVPVHFEPKKQYDNVQLRFRHAVWEGILNVTIPAVPDSGDDSSSSQSEIALIYSVIFGGVAVGCAILVVVILALKYIQWTRRDNDKVTNFREKSKEEFQRMSLKRSSVGSVKSKLSDKSTNV